ncbi:MAG: hypothetical protein V4730_11740 [Pseudomonadota bacterium]
MAINTAYTANNASQKPDSPAAAAGRITYPATSIVAADYTLIECGFTPRYVQWCDVTSRIQIEWFEGMAADTCVKTAAAGTRTLETTNLGITICDAAGTANTAGRYFKVSQNATLAAILASEVINWRALG